MERVIAVAALGIAVIVMGSIIVPAESPAGSLEQAGPHGSDEPAGEEHDKHTEAERSGAIHDDLPLLGTFESKRYRIQMYSTDIGVRYTVLDAETGESLGKLLSLEQAKRWFPDAALWDTDFSAPTESDNDTIMYSEPDPAAPGMR